MKRERKGKKKVIGTLTQKFKCPAVKNGHV